MAMPGGGGFCFSLGPGIAGLQVRAVCNRIPRHSGDHIDASEDGLIVCRWPSAPRHDAGAGDLAGFLTTRERELLGEERAAVLKRDFDALRAQLTAADVRYARAVAEADDVRARLVEERDRLAAIVGDWRIRMDQIAAERDAALAEVARLTRERDEKSAHVDKLQSKLARALAATNGGA
jgi:hypothetical protein